MAGQMPPLVIPSEGAVVIKSQLMDPAPLYIMNPKMVNRMSTMPKLNKRKMPNAMLWDLFFALWCFLVWPACDADDLRPRRVVCKARY